MQSVLPTPPRRLCQLHGLRDARSLQPHADPVDGVERDVELLEEEREGVWHGVRRFARDGEKQAGEDDRPLLENIMRCLFGAL